MRPQRSWGRVFPPPKPKNASRGEQVFASLPLNPRSMMDQTPLDRIGDARRLELLVNAIVDYAIFMLDTEGIVRSWNPGAERLKGYSATEIIGQSFSAFYTPEDREKGLPQRALAAARETGRFNSEGWRVRKDGTRFWALVVLDAIRFNNLLMIVLGNLENAERHSRQLTGSLLGPCCWRRPGAAPGRSPKRLGFSRGLSAFGGIATQTMALKGCKTRVPRSCQGPGA